MIAEKRNRAGSRETRTGRRASQVIANLGIAHLYPTRRCVVIFWLTQNQKTEECDFVWILPTAILAALAEATADTVSSEIGQAIGGNPFLLTTLRQSPTRNRRRHQPLRHSSPESRRRNRRRHRRMVAWVYHAAAMRLAFAAAVLGLFFDSLLGATLERRGWIGNDLVNFTSTAFAAALCLIVLWLVPVSAHTPS